MVLFRRRSGLRRTQQGDEAESRPLTELLITILDPTDAASEAYRSLRTNLIYSLTEKPPKVVVVTSPSQAEGKSTTCANLGVVLTQAGKRTLIVDCDMRKPVMHRFFGLRNIHGIVDVLVGERSVEEVWKEPVPGLKVISVGPVPRNPAEFVGSQRLSEFFDWAREEFDYVLVDAPPVVPVSDPAILATQGDGVLLVLDAQNTPRRAVRQSVRTLEAVGANVLGTIMNNVSTAKGGYYHSYGYYGREETER